MHVCVAFCVWVYVCMSCYALHACDVCACMCVALCVYVCMSCYALCACDVCACIYVVYTHIVSHM